MSPSPPTFMEPAAAGRLLASAIKNASLISTPLTISDAAAASGLALRDADRGMHWLTKEYRGHLRVTESGELLFLFPYGFAKPWETKDAVDRALARAGHAAVGVGRFVVRAWIMIVLLAYVAIFVAILLGMTFARGNSNSNNRRGGFPGGAFAYVFLRVLSDAFFWTFHPFSPFNMYGYGYGYGGGRAAMQPRAQKKDETPFYEKVNRFFFGPTPPKEEPQAKAQHILAEVRAQKGRIGLADVMRVTGLPREEADPLMARLMLDYDGDVEVSEDGGIFYRFEEMRKTADGTSQALPGRGPHQAEAPALSRPAPAWEHVKKMLPLTGNDGGSNAIIVALNAFNIVMSLVAFDLNLTLAKLPWIFSPVPLYRLPYMGTPIVLGVVPLVFSLALFLLPLGRAIARPFQAKAVAEENGRLAVLREVLTRVEKKEPVTDAALVEAWSKATGTAPASKELTRRVVDLGGDAEIQEATGEVRYRFVDLETEAAALEVEREGASDDEKKVGKVVFASDR